MPSIRTRLACITAASALVFALGTAFATGPAVAGESPEASSAPIAAVEPAQEGTDALAAPCWTRCWVLIRAYSSEAACIGGGVGLIASSSRYDDFRCSPSGPAHYPYWDLFAHRR